MPVGRWHLLCVSHTGHLRESSNEITGTLHWLHLCAKRDSFPVHPEWLISSTTQQSSLFLAAELTVSHNPPGRIHLSQSTSIALIWRLFAEEIKENLKNDNTEFLFYGATGPSTFLNKIALVETFIITECLKEWNCFFVQNWNEPAEVWHMFDYYLFLGFFYILHDTFLGI